MKVFGLFVAMLWTTPGFAGDVAMVFYCPDMLKGMPPYEQRRKPEDPTTEQMLEVFAGRWAPFSPIRARRVLERSKRLLSEMTFTDELPPPTGSKPAFVTVDCKTYSAATLDQSGRMLAKKSMWEYMEPADRAFVSLELALTQEVGEPSLHAIEGIRHLLYQLVGNIANERLMDMVGNVIGKDFYREEVYESGDILLLPPSAEPESPKHQKKICGYTVPGLAPVNTCEETPLYAYSLDKSRVLRVSRAGEGLGPPEPIYLYPPDKLGLPSGVTNYYFSYAPETERQGVLLTFDREVTFSTSRLRQRCAEKTPVAMTIRSEDLEKRDFRDLRFYGCTLPVHSEIWLGGKYVDVPARFKDLGIESARHVFTKEREIEVLGPASVTWGSFQFTISPQDRIEVADFSKGEGFADDNALQVKFGPESQRDITGLGLACTPKLSSIEEVGDARTVTVSVKDKCRLKGLQTQVRVQTFQIDADSRRVLSASSAWIRDKKVEVEASEVRFRPGGELWSFRPKPASKGLRYFDTEFKVWKTKEADFPSVDRLCYNPELKRFEDGRSSNPACPPVNSFADHPIGVRFDLLGNERRSLLGRQISD